jgi:AraC family transcriptional regulator
MEPTYIEIAAKTVAGLGVNFIPIMSEQSNAAEVIGPLWESFMNRIGDVPGAVHGTTYGVMTTIADKNSMIHQHELRYIAGVEVAPGLPVPDGMERVDITAGRYAVFTHKGLIAGLPETARFIYSHWIPRSGKKVRKAPHFELYDARFKHDSPDSELDIYVPLV